MTATLERRKEVLKLAREFNFIILEGPFKANAVFFFAIYLFIVYQ